MNTQTKIFAATIALALALPTLGEAAGPKPYRPRNAAPRGQINKLNRSFQTWFSGSAAEMAHKGPFARQATALRQQGYAFVAGWGESRARGEATRARTLRPKGKHGSKPYTLRQLRRDPFEGRPERRTDAKDGDQGFMTRGEHDGRIVAQHAFTLRRQKTVEKLRAALATQMEREGFRAESSAAYAAAMVNPGQRVVYKHTWVGAKKVRSEALTSSGKAKAGFDLRFPLP